MIFWGNKMNDELKAYLRLEAIVSAAFNFFINGMISAVIHHKADAVPADPLSLTFDLVLTCLLIFILGSFFSAASLRRSNTYGILETGGRFFKYLSRLFRRPILFGAGSGVLASLLLLAVLASLFALSDVRSVPFYIYITVKPVACALLGGGYSLTVLYSGMQKTESIKK
jgi:hypothetical protein